MSTLQENVADRDCGCEGGEVVFELVVKDMMFYFRDLLEE